MSINNAAVTDTAETRLTGSRLRLARVLWLLATLLTVAVFLGGLPLALAIRRTVCLGDPFACPLGQITPVAAGRLLTLGISLDAYGLGYTLFTVAVALAWWLLAALVFARRSDDWMALLVALMLVLQGANGVTETLAASSGVYFLVNNLGWFVLQGVLFLFPDGRFAPRWTGWLLLGLYATDLLSLTFPGTPLAITSEPLVGYPLFLASIVGVQVYRYWRVSGPMERQQTKWAVFGIAGYALGIAALLAIPLTMPALNEPGSLYGPLLGFAVPLFQLLIPLSFALAILRSRLYDIDLLIRRTLIYGVLTALLGGAYLAAILLLQALLRPLVGTNDELAVVASTLLLVALFTPLRRRVQAFIDHRFYRRRYDATRTVAAFSAAARNAVELDDLRGRLLAVVDETLHPAYRSLWVRDPPRHAEPASWRGED
ncbi:MAG TPA: hypothetical protein VM536_07020 [Chloroflexia bacterium]|nr:hypothetical protein [Chloroflexia bacterium]